MAQIKILALIISITGLIILSGCGATETDADIRYCSVGDLAEDDFSVGLNIEIPSGEGPFPTIVFIAGSSFQGDVSEWNQEIVEAASRGYVGVSMDYRRTDIKLENGDTQYPWDAQLEDVKCAIRYLRANAALHNIDANNIGTAGWSAGAHLSLMAGMTPGIARFEQEGQFKSYSSDIQASVSFSAPTDLALFHNEMPGQRGLIEELLVDTPAQNPAIYIDASPITYAGSSNTPLLVIHGLKDVNVLPNQALLLMNELALAGHSDNTLIMYEESSHFWRGTNKESRDANMYAFFEQKLKGNSSASLSCSPYPSCLNYTRYQ